MRTFIFVSASLIALAGAAAADPVPAGTSDVERAFGMGWDSFDRPINPATRDANGNRVIVNGRIVAPAEAALRLHDRHSPRYAICADRSLRSHRSDHSDDRNGCAR